MFQLHSTSKSCWGTLSFSITQPLFEVKQLKWKSWKDRCNKFSWWCIEKVAGYFFM